MVARADWRAGQAAASALCFEAMVQPGRMRRPGVVASEAMGMRRCQLFLSQAVRIPRKHALDLVAESSEALSVVFKSTSAVRDSENQ